MADVDMPQSEDANTPSFSAEVVHTVHLDIPIPPGCGKEVIRFPVKFPNSHKAVLKKVEVLQYHNSVPSTVYCQFSDIPSSGRMLVATVEGDQVMCQEVPDVHYVCLYQPGGYTYNAPSQKPDVVFDNAEKIDKLLQEVDIQYMLLDLNLITTLPTSRNNAGVMYYLLVDQPGLQHLTGPLRMYIKDNENCDLFQGAIEDFNGIPGIRVDRLESVIGPIVKEIHQKVQFVNAQQYISFIRADAKPFGEVPYDFDSYSQGTRVLLSGPQRLSCTVRYYILPVSGTFAQTVGSGMQQQQALPMAQPLSMPVSMPMAIPQHISVQQPMMNQMMAQSMTMAQPMSVQAMPQVIPQIGTPIPMHQQAAPLKEAPMTLQQRHEMAMNAARQMQAQQQAYRPYMPQGYQATAAQVYRPSQAPAPVQEQRVQEQVKPSPVAEKKKVAYAYPT